MQGTTRTSILTVLLTGLLIGIALVTGCGGDEEAREEGAQVQTTEQDAQPTSKESTEEPTGAPGKISGGKARDGEATLEMRGDEGTEFSGSCTVGDQTSEIAGQAPESFTYELDGERLDCQINASGNLEINFTAGNTRSVQQISGGALNLTYENGQVSSSITSAGSGGSSSSSQVVSSSQSSSSSIEISP